MKVLAVDDDLTILELLEEAFALLGFGEVVTASSGAAALDLIRAERRPFDCILLDIQMPEMDGIVLCREIRALRGYSRTPILMLTAMSQRDYIERAFAAGASDYITKPFDFLELGSRLRMAHKLVQERHLVADGQFELEKLRNELDANLKYSLTQPIDIMGVPRSIGYMAFENYILQLSRGSQLTSAAFAVKVSGINDIYAASTGTEFRNILHSVAEAISQATEQDGTLLSYRGQGLFMCVTHSRSKMTIDDLEGRINENLTPDRDNSGRTVKVSVGDRTSLASITKYGPLQAVHKAIGKIERKMSTPVTHYAIAPKGRKPAIESEDQVVFNRFAFEAMLRDTLKDEIHGIRN
jgi:CheY-like chemotaxis protein